MNHLVNNVIPSKEEDDLDEDKFIIELEEEEKKFKQNEKELIKNIIELFDKDPKFIDYISNYVWQSLVDYINNNEASFKKQFHFLEKNINEKNILYLKLDEIKNVILSFKLYNFGIAKDFANFVDNYEEILATKKIKKAENKEIAKGITNYKNFIEKLKYYIKELDEKVIIAQDEPSQFIFKLFLKKIGYDFI